MLSRIVKINKLAGLVVLVGILLLGHSMAFGATFYSGLTSPTGLAIHPSKRVLYVKSGTSGTVWKIPITTTGKAGSISVCTDQFNPTMDIDFDASGNLYGMAYIGGDSFLYRISSDCSVCSSKTTDSFNAFSGVAVEAPGLPTNRIFLDDLLGYTTAERLGYGLLNQYSCNQVFDVWDLGQPCGAFRFLIYRTSVADLVGSYGNTVASVNIGNASCSTLVTAPDLIQPNGLAEDTEGNLYIADTGAGKIIKRDILGNVKVIATGLSGPTGLAFDSVTGLLFVSESTAGRITALPVGIALSGKIKLRIKNISGQWGPIITAPPLTNTSPNTPAACVDESGNLYVFESKLDNYLYMSKRAPAGTWSAWTKLPGTMLTASSPTAVCEPGGTINLYARGLSDDKVYESIYTISSKTWGAWKTVLGQTTTPESPEATIDQAGNVYLLIRGMQ